MSTAVTPATATPSAPAPATLTVPRSLPLLLAGLSMMGPFSIDTYLPSFHEIERTLHATPLQVQQSLTVYLIPFAVMSLWHGALSDALGRRKAILITLCVSTCASIGCTFTQSIGMFWTFRFLQGVSAGVFIVARAVIRDVYGGKMATRVMSQVSVLFAVAPALGPILGGQLHSWFGWRSVFVFLACFSAGLAIWTALALPETHPPELRNPLHPRRLLRLYRQTLTHPGFVASSLTIALFFTGVFIFVASVNPFLVGHLHLKETQFIWLFGPITAGLMLGGWISGKVAGHLRSLYILMGGGALVGVSALANLIFHLFHEAILPWSVVPIFFYTAGLSFILPTLTILGLDYFPRHRGLAASCQAFIQTAANALTAGVLSPLFSSSPLSLTICSAGLVALGLSFLPFVKRGAMADPYPTAP